MDRFFLFGRGGGGGGGWKTFNQGQQPSAGTAIAIDISQDL